MENATDLRPALQEKSELAHTTISPQVREALLIKCWMAHDARWFNAVAKICGMEAANQANQDAVREIGKSEARRLARLLNFPQPKSLEDLLQFNEIAIRFFGPELLNYRIIKTGTWSYRMEIQECYATVNIQAAGLGDVYECGIPLRPLGWMESFGFSSTISPGAEQCMKYQGKDCAYTIDIQPPGKTA